MQALFTLFLGIAFAQEPQPSSDVTEKVEEAASTEEAPKAESSSPEKTEDKKEEVKAEKPASESSDVKSEEKAKSEEKKDDSKKEGEKEAEQDPAETLSVLVKAVQDKNWILAVAALTMLLVFAFRKFGLLNMFPAKATPWIAIGIAVGATSGSAILSGIPVSEALIQGIIAGLSSAGIWSAAGKHVLGSESSEEEEETADA